jgi:HSP20 family protein
MALMRRQPRALDPLSVFGRAMVAWPDWMSEPFQTLFEAEDIPVEEFEDDGTYVIRAELPGIDPERDVEVTVQNGVLRLRAERREEEKTEKTHYVRQEIRYGAFVRNIALPAGCTEKDVAAEYRDGILTVRLPVGEGKAAATRIPVTHS